MTTKDQQREYSQKWYYKDVEKSRQLARENYQRNKKAQRLGCIRRQHKYYASWVKYLPAKAKCEICGKQLFIITKDRAKKIYFDHTIEECHIKSKPSDFLNSRYCSEENIKIWESCNFGILCRWCNMCIPTNKRKEWLKKVTNYVKKYSQKNTHNHAVLSSEHRRR